MRIVKVQNLRCQKKGNRRILQLLLLLLLFLVVVVVVVVFIIIIIVLVLVVLSFMCLYNINSTHSINIPYCITDENVAWLFMMFILLALLS